MERQRQQQQEKKQANAKHRHSRGGKYTEIREYTTGHALCATLGLPIYPRLNGLKTRRTQNDCPSQKAKLTSEGVSFASLALAAG
jgi:hypothetical protein